MVVINISCSTLKLAHYNVSKWYSRVDSTCVVIITSKNLACVFFVKTGDMTLTHLFVPKQLTHFSLSICVYLV